MEFLTYYYNKTSCCIQLYNDQNASMQFFPLITANRVNVISSGNQSAIAK